MEFSKDKKKKIKNFKKGKYGDRKPTKEDRKKREERKKNREQKNYEKRMARKVYEPDFVVYDHFECPSEIKSFMFIQSPMEYRRPDGKVECFRKGQLVLEYGNNIIGTLDGRYGKAI